MIVRDLTTQSEEVNAVVGRLLNCPSVDDYGFEWLLAILDVKVDHSCASVALRCWHKPVLHVNPDFIRHHCQSDEHLLLLLMHELYHVIVGYGESAEGTSFARDIACDALVNAVLCYRSNFEYYAPGGYDEFCEQLYSPRRFPERLLRPPSGWPGRPAVAPGASREERCLMQLLYGGKWPTATFKQVLEITQDIVPDTAEGTVFLLGNHDKSSLRGDQQLLKTIVASLTKGWPRPDELKYEELELFEDEFAIFADETSRAWFLHEFRSFLREAGVIPDFRLPEKAVETGFQPECPSTLHPTGAGDPAARQVPRTYIYIDVRNSLRNLLTWLVSVLEPLQASGSVRVFAFNDMVWPVNRGRVFEELAVLMTRHMRADVYSHVLSGPASQSPSKVVVLLDWVGCEPSDKQREAMRHRGIDLYVGVIAPSMGMLSVRELNKCGAKVTLLSPPYGS